MNQFFLLLRRPALWIIITLLAGCTLESCQLLERCQRKPHETVLDEKLYPVRWNSATIQLSDDLADSLIIVSLKKAAPSLQISEIDIRHCACDPKLIAVTLAGNFTISGSGPAIVKTGDNGQSGDLGLPAGSVVGRNYFLDPYVDSLSVGRPADGQYPGKPVPLTTVAGAKTVRIGVFDTGLDESRYLPGTAWQYPARNCAAAGVLSPSPTQPGFSFVNNAGAVPVYRDDNGFRHGSKVAKLIADQFKNRPTPVVPLIIPFKVLDEHNQGDMFSLLCALETARLNGVQVYNLSLGYYGDAHPLLRQYLLRILQTNPNAYIVVASGNRVANDTAKNHNVETMYPKFYPAAFAFDSESAFKRLLMVTTIQRSLLPTVESSIHQNFSPNYGWGVRGDTGDRFLMDIDNQTILGSSFATPILSGRLARLIGEGVSDPVAELIDQLKTGSAGASGQQVSNNKYLEP